jgi:UDP-4-amino-4,6-dideoxy-N-acetyl-beta-L-altrosamine N-acetyltransferase
MSDINLVRLKAEDLELVRSWRNSEDVAKYMYNESYISEKQQLDWFEGVKFSSNSIYWVIEYNGKKLGLASLTGIDHTLQSCYWAFYLGDTSIRGGGIGAKVEYNVIEYVFSEMNLNKLRCEVFVLNDKVIKMHEKFGFRREAYYREHCIKNNEKLDVIGLALLKSDWQQIKNVMKTKIYGE